MSPTVESEHLTDYMIQVIEGDYRFAFTKTGRVFHLYDGRCLCRSPRSGERGVRKARKWYLKEKYTNVPDGFGLCLDCLHILQEGERTTQIREDIRKQIGTVDERPPENPFTKEELRKIRSLLTNFEEND